MNNLPYQSGTLLISRYKHTDNRKDTISFKGLPKLMKGRHLKICHERSGKGTIVLLVSEVPKGFIRKHGLSMAKNTLQGVGVAYSEYNLSFLSYPLQERMADYDYVIEGGQELIKIYLYKQTSKNTLQDVGLVTEVPRGSISRQILFTAESKENVSEEVSELAIKQAVVTLNNNIAGDKNYSVGIGDNNEIVVYKTIVKRIT